MPSKKRRVSFKEIISDMFELPKDVVMDLPRMTLVGNIQVYLENHRGVIAYNENLVRIGVANGEIIIRGRNLSIENLAAAELLIKGSVEECRYEV